MHRSHPAIRVVMATLYSFTVALMHDRLGLAMALGFSMGLWALAALPLRTMVKRLTAAGGLLVLIWLVVPFTDPGDPLLRIGPLAAGRTGVDLCIQISLKVPAILLALTALVATMDLATPRPHPAPPGGPLPNWSICCCWPTAIFSCWNRNTQRLHRAARMRNFRPRHQSAYLQNLRLSDRHALCPRLRTRRTGFTRPCVAGASTGASIPCSASLAPAGILCSPWASPSLPAF